MKKKGSLALSANAIVVMIIAFVVLGLALTLTRFIFNQAQDKTSGAFDEIALESEPTTENQITIPATLRIKRNKAQTEAIGVYNKYPDAMYNTALNITQCTDSDVLAKTTVTTLTRTIDGSGIGKYSVKFKTSANPGTYICEFSAVGYTSKTSKTEDTKRIISKQFNLEVVS